MSLTSIGGSSALQQQLQAMFAKADLNADGQLSSDEFQSIGQNLPQPGSSGSARPMRGGEGGGQNFASATMSSLLSMQEDRSQKIFSGADSNGDGTLTAEELSADMAAHAPPGNTSGTDAASRAADLVGKADTDGDGVLSLDEFKAAAPPPPPGGGHGPKASSAANDTASTGSASDPMDTNGDGKVSMAELLASLQSTDSSQTGFSSDASTLLAKLISQLTADTTDPSATTTTSLAA